MILLFITIFMMFVSFHLYQKDKNRQETYEIVKSTETDKKPPRISKTLIDETSVTKGTIYPIRIISDTRLNEQKKLY